MKKQFARLITVIVFSITTIIVNAQVNKTDSLALVDLYNSTNGSNWIKHTNWLMGPVKNWFGITLSNNRVSSIILSSNNLSGVIPSSIGNLSGLQQLWLYVNKLSGGIPSAIGNLSNLGDIALFNNQLSGSIPSELGNLSNLWSLNLDANQLSGSIPPSLGSLSNLSYLSINYNQLSGSIPPELGNLTNLVYLFLNNNQLSGSIPPELGSLSNLLSLEMVNNQLSGSIPSELGNLSSLTSLYLTGNHLSGAIPTFGTMPNLNALDLSNNQFTFEGMENLVKKFPFAVYDNQAKITVNTNGNTLSVSAGGTLSNNVYLWVKKGQKDYIRISGDSIFHPTESGTYLVRVKNKIATELALTSKSVHYTTPPFSSVITADKLPILNGKFIVYPNPAKDFLHVTTTTNGLFLLINGDGKVLLSKTINRTGSIDISKLPNGTYYLKNISTNTFNMVMVVK